MILSRECLLKCLKGFPILSPVDQSVPLSTLEFDQFRFLLNAPSGGILSSIVFSSTLFYVEAPQAWTELSLFIVDVLYIS
jgi:hypothetical protein